MIERLKQYDDMEVEHEAMVEKLNEIIDHLNTFESIVARIVEAHKTEAEREFESDLQDLIDSEHEDSVEKCSKCDGVPEIGILRCSYCNGTGKVK